jgi:hypothetical protein
MLYIYIYICLHLKRKCKKIEILTFNRNYHNWGHNRLSIEILILASKGSKISFTRHPPPSTIPHISRRDLHKVCRFERKKMDGSYVWNSLPPLSLNLFFHRRYNFRLTWRSLALVTASSATSSPSSSTRGIVREFVRFPLINSNSFHFVFVSLCRICC